ncbi:hypothetical protein EW146_g6084 [Bondarzewia mesenterica]|uniref:Rhodopsin domain-containing protein n=1 Tax=Bondarzewia mesenterica TaxID=1095465 RepID=A0A4V3XEM4_9AGAM|nr:hypothetical protein EW146_g6084 [Bondarzewia mesenterica]
MRANRLGPAHAAAPVLRLRCLLPQISIPSSLLLVTRTLVTPRLPTPESPQGPISMGVNIHDPLVKIKVTQSVCGFIAICMTAIRIYIRRGRYWWDDAWAFFSLLNLFVQFASVFMHVDDPSELSKTNRVAAYYLMATTFYTIIWSARLSILFSIIRIDPDPRIRRRLKWVVALFVAAIFFFLAQLMWVCEPKSSWKNLPSPQCQLNKEVAICQLVSDVFSDLLLIILPLRLIHGIKDRGLRRRLIIIFSTSIVTTIVSLVHAAYIIADGGIKVIISALVEDCMSLTVANVPVVATALVRHLGLHSHSDDHTSYTDESPDGPRFSSFRFKSRITDAFTRESRGTAFGTRITRDAKGTTTDGTGTDTDLGLMSKGVLSTTYSTDDEGAIGQTSTAQKEAHYISVGSMQGESQWQPNLDPAFRAQGKARKGEGEHYISVGSVRVQEPVREEEEGGSAPLGVHSRTDSVRIPVVRIGSLWTERQKGKGVKSQPR